MLEKQKGRMKNHLSTLQKCHNGRKKEMQKSSTKCSNRIKPKYIIKVQQTKWTGLSDEKGNIRMLDKKI